MRSQPFAPALPCLQVTASVSGLLLPMADFGPARVPAEFPADRNLQGPFQLTIWNRGAFPVFLAWGDATASCTESTGYACAAGTDRVITVPSSISHLFLLAAGGSSFVHLARGLGW